MQKSASSSPQQQQSSNDGLMAPPVGRAGQSQKGPRIAQVGTGGEKLSCLAEVFAMPAPAKFCVRAKIVGFWPAVQAATETEEEEEEEEEGLSAQEKGQQGKGQGKKGKKGGEKYDLSRFVMDKGEFYRQANADGGDSQESSDADHSSAEGSNSRDLVMDLLSAVPEKEYMFALRVADHTGLCDVILSGNDARFFFDGVTASEFNADWRERHYPEEPDEEQHVQDKQEGPSQRIEAELMQVVGSGKILQFYLRSYTGAEDSGAVCKRFAAFNTNLFQ